MFSILLALTLLTQVNPALQSDNGTISGVLKSSDGKPVEGVRVAAMLVPDPAENANAAAAMVSLVATDDMGRYRLENIPPGRYYIVAGRVDFPTYFPGAQEMTAGTVVSVTAKANLTAMDFALKDASFRLAGIDPAGALTIPVLVISENGIKQPVSANGKSVMISLTRVSDGARDDAPLANTSVTLPFFSAAIGAEYRVAVENLPDGYKVRSMKYGATDLTTQTLKVDATNFHQLGSRNVLSGTNVLSFLTVNGTFTGLRSGNPGVSGIATSIIEVTLGAAERSTPPASGMRITGKAPVLGAWSIFRGTTPGMFFADGTFEFTGVPSGKHIVVLQEDTSSRFYAAFVNVADRDVDSVTLDSAGVLPNSLNLNSTGAAGASGTRPLAGLLGTVVEADSGKPLNRGMVTVLGQSMATISIGTNGQFIIPHLLPGSYDLRIEAFEHFTLYETVVIADEEKHVDFKIRSSLSPPASEQ